MYLSIYLSRSFSSFLFLSLSHTHAHFLSSSKITFWCKFEHILMRFSSVVGVRWEKSVASTRLYASQHKNNIISQANIRIWLQGIILQLRDFHRFDWLVFSVGIVVVFRDDVLTSICHFMLMFCSHRFVMCIISFTLSVSIYLSFDLIIYLPIYIYL